MKLIQNIFVIAATSMLMLGCKQKTLDIYEPYKDVTIIYGLLNPADSIQYVKIYKGFLGTGDANDYAQIPDSIYYPTQDVRVSLVSYKLTSTGLKDSLETIVLKDTLLPTMSDNGTFTAKKNLIYYTKKAISGNSRVYKLVMKNLKTNKEVIGETNMIDLGASNTNFVPKARIFGTQLIMFDELGKSRNLSIAFSRGANGNLFNLVMRINYIEYKQFDRADSVLKYIDYPFDQTKSSENVITFSITGSQILNFIKSRYSTTFKDKTYSRTMRNANFYLSVAAEDLTTYMELNSPRASYLLDKPIYTNITNGYGIFANRYSSKSVDYGFETKTIKTFQDSLTGANIIR